MILSKNIHEVRKTDYVWFEFLWIRRYHEEKKFQSQIENQHFDLIFELQMSS